MPRRPAGAAYEPSAARAASHPPAPQASRPQEIPNARAREDTTTRRPARNSKRARARYWRRGGRPLRVRNPKIFLGKGSKNRFRGAGAGKVGGVKNATEEENGAVLGKKEAAYAAADGEIGGRLYIWNGRALAYARGTTDCAEVGGDGAAGIIFVASRKWSEGERDGAAATGNRKAEPPTVCWQLRYYSFCSRSPVSHTRETPRTRAKMASS